MTTQDVFRSLSTFSSEKLSLLRVLLAKEGLSPTSLPIVEQRRTPEHPPLSFAEQRFWFLNQLHTDASIHHRIVQAVRVKGRLQAGALQASLNEIVRQHEALRTIFVEI